MPDPAGDAGRVVPGAGGLGVVTFPQVDSAAQLRLQPGSGANRSIAKVCLFQEQPNPPSFVIEAMVGDRQIGDLGGRTMLLDLLEQVESEVLLEGTGRGGEIAQGFRPEVEELMGGLRRARQQGSRERCRTGSRLPR